MSTTTGPHRFPNAGRRVYPPIGVDLGLDTRPVLAIQNRLFCRVGREYRYVCGSTCMYRNRSASRPVLVSQGRTAPVPLAPPSPSGDRSPLGRVGFAHPDLLPAGEVARDVGRPLVDFGRQTLWDGLEEAGFDFGQLAVFSWVSVTMYLTLEVINATSRR